MAGYLADVKAIGGRTWTQVEWESRFFGYKRANTTTPSSWGTAAGRVGLWRGARLAGRVMRVDGLWGGGTSGMGMGWRA